MLTSFFMDEVIFSFKFIYFKAFGSSPSSSYIPQSTVVGTMLYVYHIIFLSYGKLKNYNSQ